MCFPLSLSWLVFRLVVRAFKVPSPCVTVTCQPKITFVMEKLHFFCHSQVQDPSTSLAILTAGYANLFAVSDSFPRRSRFQYRVHHRTLVRKNIQTVGSKFRDRVSQGSNSIWIRTWSRTPPCDPRRSSENVTRGIIVRRWWITRSWHPKVTTKGIRSASRL